MNKKTVLGVIGLIAIIASIVMFQMSKSSHTTELKDFWWYPLPLALVCFLVANAKKKTE